MSITEQNIITPKMNRTFGSANDNPTCVGHYVPSNISADYTTFHPQERKDEMASG